MSPSAAVRVAGLLVALGLVSGHSSALAESRPMSLEDLGDLVDLSEPRISPDGASVALVTSRADYDENRFTRQLVLVDVESGAIHPLTHDRPSVRQPRWSPEGDRLAFLAAGDDQKPQIFVLRLQGGEALRLTEAPEGVSSFAWRPDGEALAYVATDPKDDGDGAAAPGAEAAPKTPDEKHNRSFEVGDNVYLADEASRPSHLWLVAADGGEAKRLTSGRGGLVTFFGRPFGWSPDGSRIALLSQPRPHSGELIRSSLELLDVGTGRERCSSPDRRRAWALPSPPTGRGWLSGGPSTGTSASVRWESSCSRRATA